MRRAVREEIYVMLDPGLMHKGERFKATAKYVLRTEKGDVRCTRLRSCSRFTVFHFSDDLLKKVFKRVEGERPK